MNEITQDQKRIKIAEACGWGQPFGPTGDWERPDGSMTRWCMVPDYFGSLDAMHEAEKMAFGDSELWQVYYDELDAMFKDESSRCATASQRAEAFGRTLNLW
jgi:hypothetical protein